MQYLEKKPSMGIAKNDKEPFAGQMNYENTDSMYAPASAGRPTPDNPHRQNAHKQTENNREQQQQQEQGGENSATNTQDIATLQQPETKIAGKQLNTHTYQASRENQGNPEKTPKGR